MISHQGPLSVAQYMALALGDTNDGYYMRRDPLGADGDFTTAPEISQMFGEMVGAWLAASWQQMSSPRGVALVELGPGRGTLMQDILRATKHVSGFHSAISVHMVEMSPALIARQQETLKEITIPITWHSTIDTLPRSPWLLVANEFFDALPIHQFIKTKEGWRERMVILGEGDEALTFKASGVPTIMTARLPETVANAPENSIYELCPAATAITEEITRHLVSHGGTALLIDYGYTEPGTGDTLQAVKNHQYHPVLETPGKADLTAHVNFASLRTIAEQAGGIVYDRMSQGEWLMAMGIHLRYEFLCRNATESQKKILESEIERLTAPEQMGTLFQCMAITPPGYAAAYGF